MVELTRAIPGSDINLHAKKQLPLRCTEGLLLVLLLAKENEAVPVLRRSVDLHRRYLSILLKLMEQAIFQTRI